MATTDEKVIRLEIHTLARSAPVDVVNKTSLAASAKLRADVTAALPYSAISPPGDHSPNDSPRSDLSAESPEDEMSFDSSSEEDAAPFGAQAFARHPYAQPGPMMDIGPEARKKLPVSRVPFHGRILMIGCGAVAQCVLPLLPRMLNMPHKNITVVDLFDNSSKIAAQVKQGVNFAIEKVTKSTMAQVLAKYLKAGDLLFDLAWEIPTLNFLEWCRAHDVLYINAALEVDNPYGVADPRHEVQKFTLYERHQQLEKRIASWGRNDGATAVIEHGANPGLVSHFVKQGLVHIAEKVIAEKPNESPARTAALRRQLAQRDFPRLAQTLGVKVIHISERDTQISSQPKRPNEFVNTWSPMGFYQEGIAPSELGWGTHEKTLPAEAVEHTEGPKHQICIRTKGINTQVRSWVPTSMDSGDIRGMVVRHGEAYTIPQHLSVYDEQGECVYRPTCHYAYCPSDSAIASLHELRSRAFKPQAKTRVIYDDVVEGVDALGCLLMGHDFNSWWIGTCLDIEEARELIPHQNATTVQVAVGLVAAVQWMVENPRRGVCVPDDLPYDRILQTSLPFLGAFLSLPVDWDPIKAAEREADSEYRANALPQAKSEDERWQFNSFLVQ